MSISTRINKTTTVGAIAACAVIGATSPVWADDGPSGPSDTTDPTTQVATTTAQDDAVVATLRAELTKLQSRLSAEDVALHDATRAAAQESQALAAAQADAAHWKAVAAAESSSSATPASVPGVDTNVTPTNHGFDPAKLNHNCHHHDGDFGDDHGNDHGHGHGHNFSDFSHHGGGFDR
jgi:fructose-specific component phosphotransferase system IIB-like protein